MEQTTTKNVTFMFWKYQKEKREGNRRIFERKITENLSKLMTPMHRPQKLRDNETE